MKSKSKTPWNGRPDLSFIYPCLWNRFLQLAERNFLPPKWFKFKRTIIFIFPGMHSFLLTEGVASWPIFKKCLLNALRKQRNRFIRWYELRNIKSDSRPICDLRQISSGIRLHCIGLLLNNSHNGFSIFTRFMHNKFLKFLCDDVSLLS